MRRAKNQELFTRIDVGDYLFRRFSLAVVCSVRPHATLIVWDVYTFRRAGGLKVPERQLRTIFGNTYASCYLLILLWFLRF